MKYKLMEMVLPRDSTIELPDGAIAISLYATNVEIKDGKVFYDNLFTYLAPVIE